MEKLGNQKYPSMPIGTAVEFGRKIAAQAKGGSLNMATVATVLGHTTANSGALATKLAELRAYGLIDGRGDTTRPTALADRLAVPQDSQEFAQSVDEMVRKVPLFNELLGRMKGMSLDNEAIFPQLQAITGLSRAEVQDHVERIGKLLREASSRTSGMGPPSSASPSTGTAPSASARPVGPQHGSSEQIGSNPNQSDVTNPTLELRVGSHTFRRTWTLSPKGVKSMKAALEYLLGDEPFWEQLEEEAAQSPPKGGELSG
jgi:hypothetical protein